MKKIFIYTLIISASPFLFSQNIKWENLSFGIVINHLVSGGDLKAYWDNTPEAGFLINYVIDKNLSFEGSISGAYFKPKPVDGNTLTYTLPDIIFVNMPGGIKYAFSPGDFISFRLFAGITNTTFFFTGKAAETIKENNIESEFGLTVSAGLGSRVYKNINIEITPGIQKIFSSPGIILYRIGLKFIINL